jgi:hypothetical protein
VGLGASHPWGFFLLTYLLLANLSIAGSVLPQEQVRVFRSIWKSWALSKVRAFVWKLLHDSCLLEAICLEEALYYQIILDSVFFAMRVRRIRLTCSFIVILLIKF